MTPVFHLQRFETEAALADAVATDLVASVRAGLVRTIALSGGRMAAPLFAALVTRTHQSGTVWAKVEWFWADERCVDPSRADSNYGVARAQLLDPLRIAAPRVHRIRGELDPAEAAAAAERTLAEVADSGPGGMPRLDLVWLGMGEDGHVASLFPPVAPESGSSPRVYRPVAGPKPPTTRVTLSFEALAAARSVWVVVAGPGKRSAFQSALAGTVTLPLGRLLSLRTMTRIYAAVSD